MESLKRFIKGSAVIWLIVIVVLVLAFLWFAKLQFSWYYPAAAIFLIAVAMLIKYVATGGGDKYFRMLSAILMAVVFGILLNVGAFSGLLPVNVNLSDLILRNLTVTGTVDLNEVTAKVVNVEEVNVDDIDSYKKSEITIKSPVKFEKGVEIKGGLTVDTATFGAVYIEDLQVDKAKINDLTVVDFNGICGGNIGNKNEQPQREKQPETKYEKPQQSRPEQSRPTKPEQPEYRPEPKPEQPEYRPEPKPEQPKPERPQPEKPEPKPEPRLEKVNINISSIADEENGEKTFRVSVMFPTDGGNSSYISGGENWQQSGNIWYCNVVQSLDSELTIVVDGKDGKWLGNSLTKR